jgi:hypothetical protein
MSESQPEQETVYLPGLTDPNVRLVVSHILEALRGLNYGQITLVVHDGAVVQIERTERKRLDRPAKEG